MAGGGSTAAVKHQDGNGQRSVTGSCTPSSTTARASPTRRSSTTSKAPTAAGFWHRAHTWFCAHGITIERVITDNGSCYRSFAWRDALACTSVVHKRTRPYRPQTNGKVERFHRILLEEWAYIRDWHSDDERHAAYDGFMHFYNHHRSHGALGWATPIDTLAHLHGDNLPAEHI